MSRILVVEDERQMRKILQLFLSEHGHTVDDVDSGEAAVARAADQRYDLAIVDVRLPGISGLRVLQILRERDPDLACVLITAHGSIRSAVEGMQAGAFDYITKPFDNDALLMTVERAFEVQRLRSEVTSLRAELASRYGFTDIIGTSAVMRDVFEIMSRVAATDVTVLVRGESGTGKELVARAIHQKSKRASGPFVAVNCSAIPSTLIESEFFGHERGAFTDAKESRAGKFELAHRGALFLDEVGDLALEAQAKLLRVLQDQQVTRLGGNRTVTVDVRVIAATHRDLEQAVARGAFRHDLYWRLNVVGLTLPPLRDRSEDLPALVDALLERIARAIGVPVTRVAPEAQRAMSAYPWPGNIRELENALTSAVVLAQGPTLRLGDLPLRLQSLDMVGVTDPPDERVSMAVAVARATERVEKALMQSTLRQCRGNRTLTAERLGINRKTLFNKMRLYGLVREADDADDDDAA